MNFKNGWQIFQYYVLFSVSLMPVPTKVAFIKFRHRRDAAVALHLTNAILVDKLIQVIPWREGTFIIVFDAVKCELNL